MATRHAVATRLVLLAVACHLALGAERPEACPATDPGDDKPWWGQKCHLVTCGDLYEKGSVFCDAIESDCPAKCGSPCCRAPPASPAPPPSEPSSGSPSAPPQPPPMPPAAPPPAPPALPPPEAEDEEGAANGGKQSGDSAGTGRPEACSTEDPGDGTTPWWGQKCHLMTCGDLYDKGSVFCDAIESDCGDACGSPCCRPAPASPAPPLSPRPPPLPPRPPAAPPSPCGNISLALYPSNGKLGGSSGATAKCRALSDAMTGPSSLISNDSWRELEFCAGCADAAGCVRFCDCLIGKTARSDCAMYATHVTLPLRTRGDSPWGSLLPISILIFFGGFMCQMYSKSQRARGGGGLGGRGNPEEEGTELLGCMPRGRRKMDEDHEKMMPSQRRDTYRGGRVPDDDDGML